MQYVAGLRTSMFVICCSASVFFSHCFFPFSFSSLGQNKPCLVWMWIHSLFFHNSIMHSPNFWHKLFLTALMAYSVHNVTDDVVINTFQFKCAYLLAAITKWPNLLCVIDSGVTHCGFAQLGRWLNYTFLKVLPICVI